MHNVYRQVPPFSLHSPTPIGNLKENPSNLSEIYISRQNNIPEKTLILLIQEFDKNCAKKCKANGMCVVSSVQDLLTENYSKPNT